MPRRFTRTRSRPPAFTPVPVRPRRNGWSAEVQCAFLAALYATGSVAAAAQAVGRSRESAHRLRARAAAASFAAAWDHILSGPAHAGTAPDQQRRTADWRKVTLQELQWRVEAGLWRPVLHRGEMRAIARKPDNSALLHLLARLDRQLAGIEDNLR